MTQISPIITPKGNATPSMGATTGGTVTSTGMLGFLNLVMNSNLQSQGAAQPDSTVQPTQAGSTLPEQANAQAGLSLPDGLLRQLTDLHHMLNSDLASTQDLLAAAGASNDLPPGQLPANIDPGNIGLGLLAQILDANTDKNVAVQMGLLQKGILSHQLSGDEASQINLGTLTIEDLISGELPDVSIPGSTERKPISAFLALLLNGRINDKPIAQPKAINPENETSSFDPSASQPFIAGLPHAPVTQHPSVSPGNSESNPELLPNNTLQPSSAPSAGPAIPDSASGENPDITPGAALPTANGNPAKPRQPGAPVQADSEFPLLPPALAKADTNKTGINNTGINKGHTGMSESAGKNASRAAPTTALSTPGSHSGNQGQSAPTAEPPLRSDYEWRASRTLGQTPPASTSNRPDGQLPALQSLASVLNRAQTLRMNGAISSSSPSPSMATQAPPSISALNALGLGASDGFDMGQDSQSSLMDADSLIEEMLNRPQTTGRNGDIRSGQSFTHLLTMARHASTGHPATQAVAVQMKYNAANGVDKMTLKLDPPELGRVEVRMEFGDDGKVKAHLIADRPDTLDTLQRDIRSLERALQDAGFNTDEGSLTFDLRQGDDNAPGQDGGNNHSNRQSAGHTGDGHMDTEDLIAHVPAMPGGLAGAMTLDMLV